MSKFTFAVFAVAASLVSTLALSQEKMDNTKDMGDMKGMDMGKPTAPMAKTHKASGVVKAVDQKAGMVTVAHGPVPSLGWDAMTMSFAVKDKALLDKFSEGKKVEFEFVEKGDDYIVTGVK